MTRFKEIKDKLRVVYNVTITKRDEEYRVNFINGKEATAYYTNDLEDAFGTGVDMRNRERTREAVADNIDGYDRDDLGESPDY